MNLSLEEKYTLIGTSVAQAESRALEWIVERVRYFNPLECFEPREFYRAVKPLSELALTCAIANRVTSGARLEPYQQLARYIWNRVFLNEAFREYLLKHAAGGFAYSLYGSLRQCGFEHPDYNAKLLELLHTRYPAVIEQLPFVKLQLAYNLDNAGMQWAGISRKAVYDTCFLASRPSPYDVAITDAYAITHVIFFLTDFTSAESPFFSAADREHFRSLLPRLLAYYLRRQNWDLTAELLVCLRALGLDQCPVYTDAWLLMLASQSEDGCFNGPAPDEAMMVVPSTRSSANGAPDRQLEYFFANYHTTLVALLALLVAVPSFPVTTHITSQ